MKLPFLDGRASQATLDALSHSVPLTDAGVSLCSRRDPRGEAARQVDAWLEKLGGRIPSTVVALGFAGGWHLEALAKLVGPGSTIFVADPHPASFLAGAEKFDFSAIAGLDVEFHFAVAETPGPIIGELEELLDKGGVCLPAIFTHPGAARAFPERYAALSAELSKLARRRFMDIRTAGALSSEWLLNAIANLPLLLSSPSIDGLKGANCGRKALVIAAGPSLDKSLDWIARAKGKVMTICVGTALKSLLAKGIVPDFVIIVDSDPKVDKQFDGVDPSLPFTLLAPPHVGPSLLKRFERRLMLFSTPLLPGMNSLLKACGALPAELKTAGTVALTAIEFARFAGATGILLAGVDLAVGSDGQSHSSSSVYDGLKLERKGLVSVPGNLGGYVFTTAQFAHYVELFDNYFPELEADGVKVWNASAGGALLKGAVFAEASIVEEFCAEGLSFDADSLCKLCLRPERADAFAVLKELAGSLGNVSRNASQLLALYEQAKREGSCSGAILAEMECLDMKINSDNLALELCGDALKALSLGVAASGTFGRDDAMAMGVAMYGALAKASDYLSVRLSETVARSGY